MDSSDEEDLLFLTTAFVFVQNQTKRKANRPRFWIREFLKRRETHGACNSLARELLIEDSVGYQNLLRMTPVDFEILLQKVAPLLKKQDTNYRQAIPPKDQLMVTLRFLATGDSYSSLMYLCRISKTKISECIPKVCEALVKILVDYVKLPKSADEWKKVSEDFHSKWNFPMCLGALDGKHVEIIKPHNSGSEFFNYNKCFSIVLLALIDAKYNFMYADIGMQGRISDGGVLNNSNFYRLLINNKLNIPPPQPLPGRLQTVPYVIVGDDAFALNKHLIKPYPGSQITGSPERIFNYRLSRARVVSENAFGILTARFRVLRQSVQLSPDKTSKIVRACIYLHNFLRKSVESSNFYASVNAFDTDNPDTSRGHNSSLLPLQRVPRRHHVEATIVRNEFKDYFMTDIGQVSWQNNYS